MMSCRHSGEVECAAALRHGEDVAFAPPIGARQAIDGVDSLIGKRFDLAPQPGADIESSRELARALRAGHVEGDVEQWERAGEFLFNALERSRIVRKPHTFGASVKQDFRVGRRRGGRHRPARRGPQADRAAIDGDFDTLRLTPRDRIQIEIRRIALAAMGAWREEGDAGSEGRDACRDQLRIALVDRQFGG